MNNGLGEHFQNAEERLANAKPGTDKTIDTVIAYCDLNCEACPVHLATLEQDRSNLRALRLEIACMYSQRYGMHQLPEDGTDCDGCVAQWGRSFSGCA